MAVTTKAAAAVLVGFVVNFMTQIVSPGGWLAGGRLLFRLAGAWLWRHGQKAVFQRKAGPHPTQTSRGGCSCFSGAS